MSDWGTQPQGGPGNVQFTQRLNTSQLNETKHSPVRVNTAGRDSERNIDELILGDTREQMLLMLKDTRITIISIGLKVASGSLYLP